MITGLIDKVARLRSIDNQIKEAALTSSDIPRSPSYRNALPKFCPNVNSDGFYFIS